MRSRVGERGPTGDHGQAGEKGEKGDKGDPGQGSREWFKTVMTIWMVVFTAIVVLALSSSRHSAARADQLEKSNCTLQQFLLTAREARLRASRQEENPAREKDAQAAQAYLVLSRQITAVGHHCVFPLPKGHK